MSASPTPRRPAPLDPDDSPAGGTLWDAMRVMRPGLLLAFAIVGPLILIHIAARHLP
jgi:hypothetical protein